MEKWNEAIRYWHHTRGAAYTWLLEFALDVHNSKVTTTTKNDMTCLGTQLDTMAQKGGSCAHGYEH